MIRHHPAPDILAAYAGGVLNAGAMLVVACHLEGCALCRQEAGLWESAGGALLEEAEPQPLSAGALDRMMARLDEAATLTPALPHFLERFDIPAPLKERPIGRRRFVTPGIWFASIETGDSGAPTYLVYAKRGTVLAQHTHRGREFTQVLAGAFTDSGGIFAQGDFTLADGAVTHAPAVTGDEECLCLISAEAPMRLSGLPARVLQRMMGTPY